jgi:hypothetical protein
MRTVLTAIVSLWLTLAPSFAGDHYVVDRERSEAIFAVRYLLVPLPAGCETLLGYSLGCDQSYRFLRHVFHQDRLGGYRL